MGEALDTIPSILNKCLFVSPDRRTNGRTNGRKVALAISRCDKNYQLNCLYMV